MCDEPFILDNSLCATCGLCCLPWQHKPGAPAHYPCAYLTKNGCELSADQRPEACREFTCKRLRAFVAGEPFNEPMGREEEWLLAMYETLILSGKADIPEWYKLKLDSNRERRRLRNV
jgi:hypothetical protein